MASKLKAIALLASTLGFAAACSDSYGPGQATVQGTYTLVSFNGSALPGTYVEEGVTVRINSSSVTLNSGNSFTTSANLTVSVPGQQPFTFSGSCAGTYTQNGATLTFTTPASNECEGGTDTATWDGDDTITLRDDTGILVYRK